MRNVKDAETKDMIHIGSDHRCIMTTFLINTSGKDTHARKKNEKHETTGHVEHEQKEKNINIEMSELEEIFPEIVEKELPTSSRNSAKDFTRTARKMTLNMK